MKNSKSKRRFHIDEQEYVYIFNSWEDKTNVYKDGKPFCTLLFKPHSPKEAKESIDNTLIKQE